MNLYYNNSPNNKKPHITKLEEKDIIIREKENKLVEKDDIIKEKGNNLDEKDGVIRDKENKLIEKDDIIREKDNIIKTYIIKNSIVNEIKIIYKNDNNKKEINLRKI